MVTYQSCFSVTNYEFNTTKYTIYLHYGYVTEHYIHNIDKSKRRIKMIFEIKRAVQTWSLCTSDETIVADNRLSIGFGSSISIIDYVFHNRLSPGRYTCTS